MSQIGEWVESGLPWSSRWDDDLDTYVEGFSDKVEDRVGIEIVVLEDGVEKTYLIGHLNNSGGRCDCCTPLYGGTVILRWRRIR